MANLNKVMLIGRLTRDPEVRTFANGGKVAKFGFAVNNRKKDQQTGQWVDEPVFVDVDVFNRGENGRQADLVEGSLRKGHQVFIEGHLRLEQWTAQDGQKRSRLSVVADNFQFLEPRTEGAGMSGTGEPVSRAPRTSAPSPPARKPQPQQPSYPSSNGFDEPEPEPLDAPEEGDQIPF